MKGQVRGFMGALLSIGVLPSAMAEATANPLSKVLELMNVFQAKIIKEGDTAEKAYTEYTAWCDDSASDKRFEIKTATTKKEKLQASIDKLISDISVCESKIDKLAKAMGKSSKDLQDAKEIREKEEAEFLADEAELMDTIDTLKRAINIVTKEMEKHPASFAQLDHTNFKAVMQGLSAIVDAVSFSAAGKEKLMALVQSKQAADQAAEADDSDEADGAPDAAVYKSKSAGLVEMMEDLQEKAEEDLAALRKAEATSKQNYKMLKGSLDDSNKNAKKDMNDEKAAMSAAEEAKAGDEKDLAITLKALKNAENALADIKSQCMQVAADHEASVQSRREELKAIEQAKKVLEESTGGAVEQTYDFVQVGMQSRATLQQSQVVTVVRRLAKRFHSATLAQLAARITAVIKLGAAAGDDPFVKVKGLIMDLIAKLEKEASDAAEEKAYCDDEMAKTEEKKSELEEDLEKLSAKMDEASAKSVALKNEVKELQAELAALAKLQAEMDKIRKEENDTYLKAKAELEEGLAGTRRALSILREYYGSKDAAAMMQTGADMGDMMDQPAKPVMHGKDEGAGGGLIGMLEVCESDFAKNLAKIQQEEDDEASYYEQTTQENKETMTLKGQDVVYKVQEFKALDKALADMASDKETMSTQLKAVNEYYTKVKDRCVAKPESYEERARRREAEIAGLKEALSILESETASLVEVRSKRTRSQVTLGA